MLGKELMAVNPFPKRESLDSSKLKEFADDNFEFDTNGKKVLKMGRKHCGKRRNCSLTSNFSFSHSVFKKTCTAHM